MSRAGKIHNTVKQILEEMPETRNSDSTLYLKYLETLNPQFPTMPIVIILSAPDIASIESVGRARRKCQELYPELRADSNVEAMRELEEEDYREYAKRIQ